MTKTLRLLVNAALLLSLLAIAPARVAQCSDVKKPEKKEGTKKEGTKESPPKSEPKDKDTKKDPPSTTKRCHPVKTGSHKECFDGDNKNCIDVPEYTTKCD